MTLIGLDLPEIERAGSESMRPMVARFSARVLLLLVFGACWGCAPYQGAPVCADRPWHPPPEQAVEGYAEQIRGCPLNIGPDKTYSLPELIDLAETHNPETRLAWEGARARAAALGVARSELFPTLVASAQLQVDRLDILFGNRFILQNVQTYLGVLDLNYTVFDFGARAGRIARARAELLAANFGFNDTHRKVIYQVEQAYYELLNALGREHAARVSLANAKAVQQAAQDRLKYGLATSPDVLEALSATAEAQYVLQTTLGAEEIARGGLATAIGASPTATIRVQPLDELPIPGSISATVEKAIDSALKDRPDLLRQVARIRSAEALVKEARAAFHPKLTFDATPGGSDLYGLQQPYPWVHSTAFTGGAGLKLSWTVFDGGARENTLALAQSEVRAAEAQLHSTRDMIGDEVWAAYANLQTAFGRRQAAVELLKAAKESYGASLEAYKYGVRNLLDVTAAQKTLARALSTDVAARTGVLGAVAALAFRTGQSIQPGAARP